MTAQWRMTVAVKTRMEEQLLCGSGRVHVGPGNGGAVNPKCVAADETLQQEGRRRLTRGGEAAQSDDGVSMDD